MISDKFKNSFKRALNGVSLSAIIACSSAFALESHVDILVEGSPLYGLNGITFDAENRMHMASFRGSEIVVMDPDSGEIINRYKNAGTPDDLEFGRDGTLYWTSVVSGEVYRRKPDGTTEIIVSGLPGANGIAMSDTGRLFVSQCFFGDGLWEVDPEGAFENRAIFEHMGGECSLNGMDWGKDGFLYGPRFFEDEIWRVDVDNNRGVPVANGFKTPNALQFDKRGRLFQLDTQTGHIYRVRPIPAWREYFADSIPYWDDFEKWWASWWEDKGQNLSKKRLVGKVTPGVDNLAFDMYNRMFVTSADDSRIVEVMRNGKNRVVHEAGMSFPGGVAASGGSVWVADHYALLEFSSDSGEEINKFRSIQGLSDLISPQTVNFYNEELVFSSIMGNAVQVANARTTEVTTTIRDFYGPTNAIHAGDYIAVSEIGRGSVWLVDKKDTSRRILASDDFYVPLGLAYDNGNLWATDFAKGLIYQLMENDQVLIDPQIVTDELITPEGLAFSPEGFLYVVESALKQLSRIDIATGNKEIIASELAIGIPIMLPDLLPYGSFNGVALNEGGEIFVTGDSPNVLYKIKAPE